MYRRNQSKKRIKIAAGFVKQGGLCWWCKLPMFIINETKQVSATQDHVEPRSGKTGHREPERKYVIAHRLCNNQRGHNSDISEDTRKEIAIEVAKYLQRCN